jgi:hypothetical protein
MGADSVTRYRTLVLFLWAMALVLGAACASGGSSATSVATHELSVPREAVETTTPTETRSTTTPSSTAVDTTPSTRSNRAAPLPFALSEVAGAVWNGRIVVVGGLHPSNVTNDQTFLYDPATDSWDNGPALPVPLHHTTLTSLGDRLYLVGGYSNPGTGGWIPQAGVWSLGPDDEEWVPEPELNTARGALAVASTGDRLIAMGGVGPDAEFLASTEIFEPGAPAWEPGPDLLEPREHFAATAVGDRVYAIGGRLDAFETNKNTVEVLEAGEWKEAPPLNHARGGIGATTVGEIPCVTGGEEPNGTIGSVECLIDGSWKVVAELELARHGLAVVTLEGAIHVIAGGTAPGLSASAIHEVIRLES